MQIYFPLQNSSQHWVKSLDGSMSIASITLVCQKFIIMKNDKSNLFSGKLDS